MEGGQKAYLPLEDSCKMHTAYIGSDISGSGCSIHFKQVSGSSSSMDLKHYPAMTASLFTEFVFSCSNDAAQLTNATLAFTNVVDTVIINAVVETFVQSYRSTSLATKFSVKNP